MEKILIENKRVKAIESIRRGVVKESFEKLYIYKKINRDQLKILTPKLNLVESAFEEIGGQISLWIKCSSKEKQTVLELIETYDQCYEEWFVFEIVSQINQQLLNGEAKLAGPFDFFSWLMQPNSWIINGRLENYLQVIKTKSNKEVEFITEGVSSAMIDWLLDIE